MTVVEAPRRLRFSDAQIEMSHGAGGKATRRLVEGLIAPLFDNAFLEPLADAAIMPMNGARIATTADGYVVRPLSFPGGSIGDLAINGTLNDLAVSGARGRAVAVSLILEAGLPVETLRAHIEAMANAAKAAGVPIACGDTKVVEHGLCDGMYVTTFGVGEVDSRATLDVRAVRAGDKVIVSGPIGDHGITILLARGELELEGDVRSDTRCIWPFVETLLEACPHGLRWMRDPTRGGVATALNELARETDLAIALDERAIPIHSAVRGACELLGLDPLHIANEGQFLAVVAPNDAERAVRALHAIGGGESAAIVGEIRAEPRRTVMGVTPYGGTRVIDMLVGDPLPRIC